MIQIDNLGLYDASLRELEKFTQGPYNGRLVQIFLACKRFGSGIPTVGAPVGVDVGNLQRLLDDLYDKPSRRPAGSIVSLFNNNHIFPTGVVGPGLATASNIWRNNFNLQKGYCCFATPGELQDPTFRALPRLNCPHL